MSDGIVRVFTVTGGRPHCMACGREADATEAFEEEPNLYRLATWKELRFGTSAHLTCCPQCAEHLPQAWEPPTIRDLNINATGMQNGEGNDGGQASDCSQS